LRDEIKYILDTMTINIKVSLRELKSAPTDHNHKVFYKDAIDGMEGLVKKHFSDEYDEMVVSLKRRLENAEQLVALALFNQKFFEMTDDILFEVQNGRPKTADDVIEYVL
jgi:hypothetical protein